MGCIVPLRDIIVGMDSQSEEMSSYLNKETGEIVTISEEGVGSDMSEELLDEIPEWERQNAEVARKVMNNEAYIPLPSRFDINEYEMMEKFTYSVKDEKTQQLLVSAIRGRGAFGRFKEHIHILGVAEEWYQFRDEAFREIAVRWCEENGIQFTE